MPCPVCSNHTPYLWVLQVLEGIETQGVELGFMSIFGEFLEGYTNCTKMAGTTPEQFQECISKLIKARCGHMGNQRLGGGGGEIE